jgi:hypothetical protein
MVAEAAGAVSWKHNVFFTVDKALFLRTRGVSLKV